MRKRILKIAIIMIMITLVYTSIVSAYSFTATMTPSSTTVAESKEFTVKIKVSNLDVGQNGINTLSGYLKYDKNVFEEITDSSIDGLNGWSPTYTADSDKITMTKPTFAKGEEEVFQVTLKTKQGVSGKSGKVEFNNILASNTDTEIQAQNISTEITVGNVSENVADDSKNSIGLTPQNNTAKPENKNTPPISVNKATNNTTNTNKVNNNPIGGTVNNSTKQNAVVNKTPEKIVHAGVEDTLFYVLGGAIIVAIVFYIKFEKINKQIR